MHSFFARQANLCDAEAIPLYDIELISQAAQSHHFKAVLPSNGVPASPQAQSEEEKKTNFEPQSQQLTMVVSSSRVRRAQSESVLQEAPSHDAALADDLSVQSEDERISEHPRDYVSLTVNPPRMGRTQSEPLAFEPEESITPHGYSIKRSLGPDLVNLGFNISLSVLLTALELPHWRFNCLVGLGVGVVSQSCAGASLRNMALINIPGILSMFSGGFATSFFQLSNPIVRYAANAGTYAGLYGLFRGVTQCGVDQTKRHERSQLTLHPQGYYVLRGR